jgi:hypothetical protein
MKSIQHMKSLPLKNQFQTLSSYNKENNELFIGSQAGNISILNLNTFTVKTIKKQFPLLQIVSHEKYMICVGDSLSLFEGIEMIASVDNINGRQITIFENGWVILVHKNCEIEKFHFQNFLLFKNKMKFIELELYSVNVRNLGDKWILVDRICDFGVLEFPSMKEVLVLESENPFHSNFDIYKNILFISFNKFLKSIQIPSGEVMNSFVFDSSVVSIWPLEDYLIIVTKNSIILMEHSFKVILNLIFKPEMRPIHNVMVTGEYLIIHSSMIHFYKIFKSKLNNSFNFKDISFRFNEISPTKIL